jgi:NAD(P)-dependent dehydrogenase (short-subunit alcohol dehydrogenase family)
MKGKICVVTGASSGMGKETAAGLARLGARVFILCRNESSGEMARSEIVHGTGNPEIELLVADLGSQRQVRAAADVFLDRAERLDVLVNNAGMLGKDRAVTEDGIELTLAVNHLGPFLLSNLLLPRLQAAEQGRVVVVASEVHRLAKLDLANIQLELGYGAYKAYCLSKLANIMFTMALAKRFRGTTMTANCLHPGVVGSRFGSGAGFIMRTAMALGRPFLRSSAKGAETAMYLATSPDVAAVNGGYFYDRRPLAPAAVALDERLAEDLWSWSARAVGLEPIGD